MNTIQSRVVIIGDSTVGKTSIFNKLAFDSFNINERATVGSNYHVYVQQIQDIKVDLQIWDTAGQERFRSLGAIYFREADAAIAVYDITKRLTFENLEMWINDFINVAGDMKTIVIVANKCDLEEDSEVSFQEAESWAQAKNYMIRQTSAKTGEGIDELFSDLAHTILQNQMSKPITYNSPRKSIEENNQNNSCC